MPWGDRVVGLLLLAGGRSERMGVDKAVLDGALSRLVREGRRAGLSPIAVLAGPAPRGEDLVHAGHVPDGVLIVDDPPGSTCLHDALVATLDGRWPAMLLCPCDAVVASAELFERVVRAGEGVPLDGNGRRQHLFAHVPSAWVAEADPRQRSTAVFTGLQDIEVGELAPLLASANTPEEHSNLSRSRKTYGS